MFEEGIGEVRVSQQGGRQVEEASGRRTDQKRVARESENYGLPVWITRQRKRDQPRKRKAT